MKNLLLCGLNSYLGRAGLTYLPGEGYRIHGIARDLNLLKGRMGTSIDATLHSVDLIKKERSFYGFNVEGIELSIYFAQIPNQRDELGVQYELLSLRNFIFLSQRNGCNRIVYVSRTSDRTYLEAVESLFVELGVMYTVFLKDLAIGLGSSFDLFMEEALKNRYVYLYSGLANKKFRPIILSDVFSFIKKVNWKDSFVNQRVEFGGERMMAISDLIQWYINNRGETAKIKIFSIPSKSVSIWLNKLLYGIDSELYDDYLMGIMGGGVSDNSIWQQQVDFKPLPIKESLAFTL
ncbi:Rossmann-fold NAD(P)-binding domain-containing protein [Sphingobacterium tabacisoli]|uniref:NAD(P)-binding domain-containing protein n=1 Tax=Sphingobacterium tabacisoli TaxID=2044855 RepID=A0ABW5L359_9SPHI|nr:hypothetical protein [Sphingobacterium tabacisoli]